MATLSAVVCTEPSAGSRKTPELGITERFTPDHGRVALEELRIDHGRAAPEDQQGLLRKSSGSLKGCSGRAPDHRGIQGFPRSYGAQKDFSGATGHRELIRTAGPLRVYFPLFIPNTIKSWIEEGHCQQGLLIIR